VTDSTEGTPDRLRLLRALTLSKRYHLYIVACPTPRAAESLLDWLGHELPRARGEPVEFVRLDPHGGRRQSSGLAREEIVRRVLSPLLEPRSAWERGKLAIVDASRAEEVDDDAWRWLFSRWNEQRNAVQARLHSELVLLLTSRLTNLFARAAPDVWSTRSGEYSMPSDFGIETAPPHTPIAAEMEALVGPVSAWQPSAEEAAKVRERPATLLHSDVLRFDELGELAMQSRSFALAETFFTRALYCARELQRRSVKGGEDVALLLHARSLESLARAFVERGRLLPALRLLGTARTELLAELDLHGDWLRQRLSVLDVLRFAQDVCLARGDSNAAAEHSEAELQIVAPEAMLPEQARSLQRSATISYRRGLERTAEGQLRAAEEVLSRTRDSLNPLQLRELRADLAQTWSDVLASEEPFKAKAALSQARELRQDTGERFRAELRFGRLDLRFGDRDRAVVDFANGLGIALETDRYLDWLEALRLTDGLDLGALDPSLVRLRNDLRERCVQRVTQREYPTQP
jgi:hypothetical protein